MIAKNQPPDPDRLPYIGPEELRNIRVSGMLPGFYDTKNKYEAQGAHNFIQEQGSAIRAIFESAGLRLGKRGDEWSSIATTPVDVLAEPIEQVAITAASIGKVADKMDRPLQYLPWLNFVADRRREQAKISQAQKKADDIKQAIQDVLTGHNVIVAPALDHLPHGTTIAGIRQRMLLGALGVIIYRQRTPSQHVYSPLCLPYLSLDADTTIDDHALAIAEESLMTDRALFVSGNLRYMGGVMDKDLEAMRQETKEMRLLYAVEHMRRHMLNALPPTRQRGYLPETGMVTTLSILANLGGYNVHAENNESYWLEAAAEEATNAYRRRPLHSRSLPTPEEARAQPAIFISDLRGQTLESITRYEDYFIDTSIEGVERGVRRFGAAAIVAFDQGATYTMRTQYDKITPLSVDHPPTDFPSHLIMSAAYSYYKLCGGELTVEGLLAMNELIRGLHLVEDNELMPGQLAWTPRYLAKEEWPKF